MDLEQLILGFKNDRLTKLFSKIVKLQSIGAIRKRCEKGLKDFFKLSLKDWSKLHAEFVYITALFNQALGSEQDNEKLINKDDLLSLISPLLKYYSDFPSLYRIDEKISPIDWLIMLEKKHIFLPKEVSLQMMFLYKGLDINKKGGISAGELLTIDKAIDFINEHMGINSAKGQQQDDFYNGCYVRLLEACAPYKIGAYILTRQFDIVMLQGSLDASTIKNEVKNHIPNSYQYPYIGLIRLISKNDFDGGPLPQSITALSIPNVIKMGGEHKFIFKNALSDLLQGITCDDYTQRNGESIEITKNDLWFRKEELLEYLEAEIQAINIDGQFNGQVFDWENFYNKSNAKIIEDLITVNTITVLELCKIFCPMSEQRISAEKILSCFNEALQEWSIKAGCGWLLPDDDGSKPIHIKTRLHVEKAISLLIGKAILPKEILRLPRAPSSVVGFEPIDTYYPEYSNIKDPTELIKLPGNNLSMPQLWSYARVKDELSKLGAADNQIEILCKNNQLGAYVKVSEHAVVTGWNNSTSINLYLKENCGNPFFPKRFAGHEKIKIDDPKHKFDLNNLFLNNELKVGYFLVDGKNINSHLLFPVETTDLETKYHVRRTIKFILQGKDKSYSMTPNDLLFLQEEVIALEDGLKNQPKKPKEKAKQTRAHALNELIDATYHAAKNKTPRAIWDHLRALAEASHDIVQEVGVWTDHKASISWRSHTGAERKPIMRSTFENRIYKLNNGHI